ncbi:MAG: MXAN_5808 family serine peptidase [bacterium]|nr:MXAN_5808 family serine peptidase [bacterium]
MLVLLALLVSGSLMAERFVPHSDLIPHVLELVNRGYVDQNRAQPLKMLEGALERVSAAVAPVLTRVKTLDGKVIIEVHVDKFDKTITAKIPKDLGELNGLLQEVAYFIKLHLNNDDDPGEVDYALINGFLKQLDPHTTLLVPDVYSEFSTSTSGNFGGVGMMIGLRKGDLTIISPIDGTPASRAGLRAKDRIVQIDDESTVNMSLSDAVKKLRGEINTKVVIYILREGIASPKKVVITRALIKVNSVESHVYEVQGKRVGYIQLKTFQKNTIEEINEALDGMDYDLNSFGGLILDLRNNPGGLLSQAIQVSDRFIKKGVIVATAGLDAGSVQAYKAQWFASLTEIPMVVLINTGSASASEIVTAALKKNDRAVVLGNRSFGKGSVQQVIPLPGGSALKMTTSKYLTPGNISIQSVGVSPHIEVVPYYISKDFVRVTPESPDSTEGSLDENFAEWGDKAEDPERTVFYLFKEEPKIEEGHEPEEPIDESEEAKWERLGEDFLVQSGLNILAKNDSPRQPKLLAEAHRYMIAEEKGQEEKLAQRFKEFDTDWTALPLKGQPKLAVDAWLEVKEGEQWKRSKGPLKAKDQARFHLKVTNQGGGNASRLIATSKSENPIFDERQFAFGSLKPGQSSEWSVPVEVPEGVVARNDRVEFKFTDQREKVLASDELAVGIEPRPWPSFAYKITFTDQGHGASGNGDGLVQPGETIAVKVEVTNQGAGDASKVTLLWKNGEGEKVFLKNGRINLEDLKAGQSSTAWFLFDYKEKALDGVLDFSFDLLDSVFPLASANQKIKLPLDQKNFSLSNGLAQFSFSNADPVVSGHQLLLKGQVADPNGVKDVYAFVDKTKVYYQNFESDAKTTAADFQIPLELGAESNRVILVTRDRANVAVQKTLFIRKAAK